MGDERHTIYGGPPFPSGAGQERWTISVCAVHGVPQFEQPHPSCTCGPIRTERVEVVPAASLAGVKRENEKLRKGIGAALEEAKEPSFHRVDGDQRNNRMVRLLAAALSTPEPKPDAFVECGKSRYKASGEPS